jgi:phosphopentomutase
MNIDRVIVIVLDSAGVGYMPDAQRYKDEGTNTIKHIYEGRGKLDVPNLCSLGLGKIVEIGSTEEDIIGCYGKMQEVSPGKDTTTGHWEMCGLNLDFEFPTYTDGFPEDLIAEFEKRIGRKTIGNYACSGTEILKELGEEHLKTGFPIVYTSADSVFQIATHEDIIPLEQLYGFCETARDILKGKYSLARVIARPFRGKPGSFERNNAGRHDYSVEPVEDTLLDKLKASGRFVCGIGKIGDIFSHRGLTEEAKEKDNAGNVDLTVARIKKYKGSRGMIFANLVDFDSVYGHRRNVDGYGAALEEFDRKIPGLMDAMDEEELLIITADHGCDPSHGIHTDHTREYVPLLVYGKGIRKNVDLGIRKTFSDCGQTIAEVLGIEKLEHGESFVKEIM